jgi:uncharacterized protein (UPF0276 family)
MRSSREASAFPGHGVGIVWWPDLDPLCRPGEGLVRVIEVEPETFWVPSTEPPVGFVSRLPQALAHLPGPKLLHGVGAPFGGGSTQSAAHLATLSGDIAALRPAWISDHLSFNRFVRPDACSPDQTMGTGFFLPPAQCREGVLQAARQIRHRRAASGVPIAFENPVSYLPPLPGEMPDGVFAAEVAEAADCGILLDLHNVLCNERNGRQSVVDYCNSLPLERVWEIHLAGGQYERGFWLDAHSGVVEPALMDIVSELVPRLPSLGAIIFEIVPDFIAATGLAAIETLLGRLNDVWAARPRTVAPVDRAQPVAWNGGAGETITPAMWESAIGAAVTGLEHEILPADFADWTRSAERPLELYRFLAREGRACALVDTAPRTIRALLTALGEARTRHLLGRFWLGSAPAYTNTEEARAFLNFLATANTEVPGIAADVAGDRNALDQLAGARQ